MRMVRSGGEWEIYDPVNLYTYWVCLPGADFLPFIYGPETTGAPRDRDLRGHADIPRNWGFVRLTP